MQLLRARPRATAVLKVSLLELCIFKCLHEVILMTFRMPEVPRVVVAHNDGALLQKLKQDFPPIRTLLQEHHHTLSY